MDNDLALLHEKIDYLTEQLENQNRRQQESFSHIDPLRLLENYQLPRRGESRRVDLIEEHTRAHPLAIVVGAIPNHLEARGRRLLHLVDQGSHQTTADIEDLE